MRSLALQPRKTHIGENKSCLVLKWRLSVGNADSDAAYFLSEYTSSEERKYLLLYNASFILKLFCFT